MLPLLTALKVLVLAGGIEAKENHHSHLVHARGLIGLLEARGVPAEDVMLFWADGVAPGVDRAVQRDAPPEGLWLISGTRIGDEVDPGPTLEHTALDPARVRPATRAALKSWLAATGPTLGADDTVLIAVTDHGAPDPTGGEDTRINLWGEATWSTRELLEDLGPVPEATRVVLWMSQCHSGGFAGLHRHRQNLCGAFSANPDRVAYGCYPDLAARPDVGHFQRLIEALTRHPDLAAANDELLLTDDSPDTPHLTSDALLFEALSKAAARANAPLETFIDTRLGAEVGATRRLAAAVASRYGLGPLRDYSAVMDLLVRLDEARYALDMWGDRWRRVWDNARELLIEKPARRVGEPRTRRDRIRARSALLSGALAAWAGLAPALRARLEIVRGKVRATGWLSGQVDQQEAATIRVAYLLSRIAAEAVLDRATRSRYEALRRCETTPLLPGAPEGPPAALPRARSLPPAQRVVAAAEALRPAYLGVHFRDRPRYAGVVVERILPDSPLLATDLAEGDIISAVNGWTLERRGGLREAVTLTEPGATLTLSGRSGRTPFELVIPAPGLPLPAPPPRIGDVVGDLRVRAYDAGTPLPAVGEGQPTVLFFWATWCKPCKAAIPALRTWARAHGANVLAITDERAPVVRRFLRRKKAMPFPIGLDLEGEARRLVPHEELPVFALVGRDRRLLQVGVGFEEALPIDPPPEGGR